MTWDGIHPGTLWYMEAQANASPSGTPLAFFRSMNVEAKENGTMKKRQDVTKAQVIASYEDMIRSIQERISPSLGTQQTRRYWNAIRLLRQDIRVIEADDDSNYKKASTRKEGK